jgi:hypothetical protein
MSFRAGAKRMSRFARLRNDEMAGEGSKGTYYVA